jgi:hypothetical protein
MRQHAHYFRGSCRERENRGLVGGGGGIRTHEGLSSLPVFKTGAFNHSATPPILAILYLTQNRALSEGSRPATGRQWRALAKLLFFITNCICNAGVLGGGTTCSDSD